MPVYLYTCKECGKEFKDLQSSSDTSLTPCEHCHSTRTKRVFRNNPVVKVTQSGPGIKLEHYGFNSYREEHCK